MKKDEIWKECRYKDCETQILENMQMIRGDNPLWMVKGVVHGYCVKCSMREFSNLIPVVNPDPDEEFLHWAMIDGELTPLVSKEK
tara:strand:+ start:361 stop:615 length:255 start_codon:yes stop_codon:yes gene_type:complete